MRATAPREGPCADRRAFPAFSDRGREGAMTQLFRRETKWLVALTKSGVSVFGSIFALPARRVLAGETRKVFRRDGEALEDVRPALLAVDHDDDAHPGGLQRLAQTPFAEHLVARLARQRLAGERERRGLCVAAQRGVNPVTLRDEFSRHFGHGGLARLRRRFRVRRRRGRPRRGRRWRRSCFTFAL